MNNKANSTSFKKGHLPIKGAFGKGSKHTDESKAMVSASLKGNTRRWKGDKAGYVAIHTWLKEHYGKPTRCENIDCKYKNPKRFEYANVSGEYRRYIEDYVQLCSSCHRKWDMGLAIPNISYVYE